MPQRDIDAVRRCLRQITDVDRPTLWTAIEHLNRALYERSVTAVTNLIARVGDNPIRACLLTMAGPFLAANRAAYMSDHRATTQTAVAQPLVRGRHRQEFLGLFKGLEGVVAPVDVWSARTGLYWEKISPDAFAAVNTSRQWHDPKPLDWRHNAGVVVGLSRGWRLGGDGALLGRFDMGSHPLAQAAARAAQAGDLALSMSVRFYTHWIGQTAPDEWDPRVGLIDTCLRDHASVEAVALTPTPAYPQATINRVW